VDDGAEQDPAGSEPAGSRQLPRRLRQIAMIVVFDLGGPLLVYGLLSSAGMSAVSALVISGILPALGIILGALVDRRPDVIGVMVLGGIAVGTILGLTTHSARRTVRTSG